MSVLSVCIPVQPGHLPPVALVEHLLSGRNQDLEIIVAPYHDSCAGSLALTRLAMAHPQLTILPGLPEDTSASALWAAALAAATGDWLTVIFGDDMLEPDIDHFIGMAVRSHPAVDAIGWNSFKIDAKAPRDIPQSVAIPIQHHLMDIDKPGMLDAFFNWTGSSNVPNMHFGLYHGAIRRSLYQTILDNASPTAFLTPVPQWEWAARVIIFAQALAFSSRPMSAVSVEPYTPYVTPSVLENFPFLPQHGLTAAIAEIQARVLAELGAEWTGFNEHFIRALMLDCMFEHDEERFENKAQGYHKAIVSTGARHYAEMFRPPYHARPQGDDRRGPEGLLLLVDRFLGEAVTAHEFFLLARQIVTPVDLTSEVDIDASIRRRVVGAH